jgi:Uma2 family endonuclease
MLPGRNTTDQRGFDACIPIEAVAKLDARSVWRYDKMKTGGLRVARRPFLDSSEPRSMAMNIPMLTEVEYPPSDGEPMAETPVHRDVMLDLIMMLKAYYGADPNVYVSGNMMMYYLDGSPHKCVSPDVFVTLGIPKLPEREIYRIWLEGKAPDVVIEVTSPSTARIDQRRKFELYRDVLQVSEYVMFDPRDNTLPGTSLCAYRLIEGEYELIPKVEGRVFSEVLDLYLEAAGEQLRLFDPRQGRYLQTPVEIREALEHETAARVAAELEVEKLRREIEALRQGGSSGS